VAYDEKLAVRIRQVLETRSDVVEKKMFGGLCFMVKGAMCCGLTKTDFMVRVGPARYDAMVAEPHARPMDFTGRAMPGMIYVDPEGLQTAASLAKWVGRGVSFVSTLPSKTATRPARKTSTKSPDEGATHGLRREGRRGST
jgi:TfoX/Sxy family transcriptional regulator of competence genes